LHLRSLCGARDEGISALRQSELLTTTLYLAHTVKVDGNLGFDVPIANPTRESILAFSDALLDTDSALIGGWDDALDSASKGSNDPDLLPPAELNPSKKKTPPHPNGDKKLVAKGMLRIAQTLILL